MLIDFGAKLDSKNNIGCTPLHLAALYGQVDTVRLLISNGANIHAETFGRDTPVHYAAFRPNLKMSFEGKKDCARILTESGAKLLDDSCIRKTQNDMYDIQNMVNLLAISNNSKHQKNMNIVIM